ncbi:hypothetical protein V2J63_12665, partial [Georgenia sp. MJ278]
MFEEQGSVATGCRCGPWDPLCAAEMETEADVAFMRALFAQETAELNARERARGEIDERLDEASGGGWSAGEDAVPPAWLEETEPAPAGPARLDDPAPAPAAGAGAGAVVPAAAPPAWLQETGPAPAAPAGGVLVPPAADADGGEALGEWLAGLAPGPQLAAALEGIDVGGVGDYAAVEVVAAYRRQQAWAAARAAMSAADLARRPSM